MSGLGKLCASMACLAFLIGCSDSDKRPYTPIAGAVCVPQAHIDAANIVDATCTRADMTTNRSGWTVITTFNINLRVDRVIKGTDAPKEIELSWGVRERRDPKISSCSLGSWWKQGSQYRLFFNGTRDGRLWALRVSTIEEAQRWLSRDIEWKIKLLGNEDAKLRIVAAKALGQYGEVGKVAVPVLRLLLQDPDAEVRAVARDALRTLGEDPETSG